MHNDIAAGFHEHIIDVSANWPGSPSDAVLVYGANFCHEWAWKWIGDGLPNIVNMMTAWNADNYQWFYIYNWFDGHWGWKEDGSQPLKRSLVTRDDSPDEVMINDDFETRNENDIDPSAAPSPVNCYDLGGDVDGIPHVECSYMGEDYTTYLETLKEPFFSDGGCILT